MRADHEEFVLRNAALTARACWSLSRSFADRGDGTPPFLIHFVIAGGLLFHRMTASKLSRMKFDSGLLKAVTDQPEIIADMQSRMENSMGNILSGLQLGSASGLLAREATDHGLSFRALGTLLPKDVREIEGHGSEILAASKRLGFWFADDPLATVATRLRVEF